MVLFIALFPTATAVQAAPTQPEMINKIENHLNSVGSMKADFTQISADGGVSNGTFFMVRPGRLRWQYEPPVPLLIIGSKGKIQYHDLELDTVSYVDMDETLAGLMARGDIKLTDADIVVKSYTNTNGVIRIQLQKKGKPEDGSLTLVLNENPMELRKFEVIDGSNQKTTISLNNTIYDVKLSDKLFEFEKKQTSYPSKKK